MRTWGFLLGTCLIAAAVVIVLVQREALEQAQTAIRARPPAELWLHVAALGGTVVLNLVLSGLVYFLLVRTVVNVNADGVAMTGSNRKVGLIEMQALIAATTLLNYLPLRAGFFSRIAYHKFRNSISVTESIRISILAAVVSLAVAALVALALLVGLHEWLSIWSVVAVPVLAGFVLAAAVPNRRMLGLALSLRALELIVIAMRYGIAFDLIGWPIGYSTAAGLACVNMVATMVPLVSNGLGLREWAIGAMGPLLRTFELAEGMTADLVIRGIEIVLALIFGLLAMTYLWRLRRLRVVDQPTPSP